MSGCHRGSEAAPVAEKRGRKRRGADHIKVLANQRCMPCLVYYRSVVRTRRQSLIRPYTFRCLMPSAIF